VIQCRKPSDSALGSQHRCVTLNGCRHVQTRQSDSPDQPAVTERSSSSDSAHQPSEHRRVVLLDPAREGHVEYRHARLGREVAALADTPRSISASPMAPARVWSLISSRSFSSGWPR